MTWWSGFPRLEGEGDVTCIVFLPSLFLLDLRRRLRVVVDVLGNMIWVGLPWLALLSSLLSELILRVGPVHPISAEDLLRVQGGVLSWFHEVARELHCNLSEFVHRVVVMRRMRPYGVGRAG